MTTSFEETITIEDADGIEHDIDVTIYYTDCAPDPSVGYNGGIEEFGFESSEHAVFNVAWLEAKLTSDSKFSTRIQDLIIENLEGREYDPGPDDHFDED